MKTALAALLLTYSMHASAYLECLDNVSDGSATWALGQAHTFAGIPGYQIGNGTATCWADGRELRFLKTNFAGLHMHIASVVIFTGDDADFILANLGEWQPD